MCGRTFGRPPEGGYLPRFEFGRDVRNQDSVGNVPLFTTSTCSLLDGSTKALRPHAQRKRHSLKTRKTLLGFTPARTHVNMIPLIPTLALAFVSFICSAFVILRILIPILPPHPLSRRVRPVSFSKYLTTAVNLPKNYPTA